MLIPVSGEKVLVVKPRKKVCFPLQSEKNWVGRFVIYIFGGFFFVQKWNWEGRKNFRVGIFLSKNLLG